MSAEGHKRTLDGIAWCIRKWNLNALGIWACLAGWVAASRAGEDVLSELGGWPGGQARTLKQIKTALLVRDDEDEEDGCLEGMAGLWGGGPSWGD